MNKENLKNGMIVELDNGFIGQFIEGIIVGKTKRMKEFSIIKTEDIKALYKNIKSDHRKKDMKDLINKENLSLLWESNKDKSQVLLRNILVQENVGEKFIFNIDLERVNLAIEAIREWSIECNYF